MISTIKKIFVMILGLSFLTNVSFSNELPLRNFSQLANPKKTQVLRVKTARVIWANYPLIRRDFKHLSSATESEIDKWLESKAIISKAQAQSPFFNEKIQTTEFEGQAYRPENYNRSAVIEVEGGYIDIKGTGSETPSTLWKDGDPRDGTFLLAAAIREELFASVVEKIFWWSDFKLGGHKVEVVKNYAILDGGFEVLHRSPDGEISGTSPWGMIFRQAHSRFKDATARELPDQGKYSLWNSQRSLAVEELLRRFGITSIGKGRIGGEGGINIQGTRGNAILDFGNYVVYEKFPQQLVYHFYGNTPLIIPGQDFVQPEKSLSLQVETWGSFSGQEVDSQKDKPWVYSYQTARYAADQIRKGESEKARSAVHQHFENMLEPFKKKMNSATRPCSLF